MKNRRDIQDATKLSQARNSQSKQWIGEVVSADTTGGRCLVNVRGNILECAVPNGAAITYGAQVSVSRVPGQPRLVVSAGGNTTIINQIAAPAATTGGEATPETPIITPDTPVELTATALSTTEIRLEWSSTGLNTTNYLIERSPTENVDDFEWIATVTVEETSYTDSGLAEQTQYWYRVRAQNKTTVSAYSNIATATTLGLFPAPGDLKDDFNRADTHNEDGTHNPLGLSWDNRGLDTRTLIIQSTEVADDQYYSSCWNVWLESYAPYAAISVTMSNWWDGSGDGNNASVSLGFTDAYSFPGYPIDYSGHWLEEVNGTYITAFYSTTLGCRISVTVPGVGSGTYNILNPQNGDQIGLAIVEGQTLVGYKPVGGDWQVVIASGAPTPYPYGTTMYPWIRMSGQAMRIDDFCAKGMV